MNWETLTPLLEKAIEEVMKIKDVDERLAMLIFNVVEKVESAERESCAKVCEEQLERPSGYQGTWEGYGKFKTQMTGQECADAIRARNKQ
jgi:hypothetical protein